MGPHFAGPNVWPTPKSSPPRAVVLDSSVLINFLLIDRMDLLVGRFVVTTHVADEISSDFPKQRARFELALATGAVEQHDVVDAAAIEHFGRLRATGRLGAGECAAIAYAVTNGFALALDDRLAAREASTLMPAPRILRTADLIVAAIRAGRLTLAEADASKDMWEKEHRFRLKITSFGDLL